MDIHTDKNESDELIRRKPPMGAAVQIWSTELPNWKLGVGVEVDLAA